MRGEGPPHPLLLFKTTGSVLTPPYPLSSPTPHPRVLTEGAGNMQAQGYNLEMRGVGGAGHQNISNWLHE